MNAGSRLFALCAVIIWFFALALSSVLGSDQCPNHKCPVPASPNPWPKQPSDVVNSLPPDQSSERIKQVFGMAKRSTKLPIRFVLLPPYANNTSAEMRTEEEYAIGLRSNLSPEQKENSIAHE